MPAPIVVDHSRFDSPPAATLPTASNLILIDNYDSFTWNVYQYLILEGATVTVYRNDQITLDELVALKPTQLVVSPGPGHPDTDAGVSRDAIRHFGGKIPIFGVCMGQQCIISVFGGDIDVTGEILHGKTSPLRHDGRGVYAGLAEDIPVTRYHSLAGTHPTIPPCLEVSSWIAAGPDGGKGVIMGVRHKEFVIEGVQFHPESILTENGRLMFRNFLTMQGGVWSSQAAAVKHGVITGMCKAGPDATTHSVKESNGNPSILDKIYSRRKELVEIQKVTPSTRMGDLETAYRLGLAPPQISFPRRLRESIYPLALMAEIKRASPSKGTIQLSAMAPVQARQYANAGASVISVLTEPDWFKGSVDDLRYVRQSLEGMPDRPAILRKEFVFDEYQILEARLAGADTVLLIVKMLETTLLTRLYKYSQSLGMEPLVEVNTAEEMKIAINLGSQVIGVNNRNLANFEVDLGTTSRLMDTVPDSAIVCALSGISGPEDVAAYSQDGVKAVLVGEALMRAPDTMAFVSTLLGAPKSAEVASEHDLAVKICGTRSAEAAQTAIEHGADFIGIIRVSGRSRYVDDATALEISNAVRSTKRPAHLRNCHPMLNTDGLFDVNFRAMNRSDRAQLVGVFQNSTLDEIIRQVRLLNLDIVQLHGTEPLEWATIIPVPVIRRFAPQENGCNTRQYHALSLLDAGSGGTGQRLNVQSLKDTFEADPSLAVMLAGGLTPENIQAVLAELGPYRRNIIAVDVSSGVESDGRQDLSKIASFIKAARDTIS